LGLLFALALAGRFDTGANAAPAGHPRSGEGPAGEGASGDDASGEMRRLGWRPAAALLILGVGLLNAASAPWAHALGVVSLFGFIVLGFLTIVGHVLADSEDDSATMDAR
jgi:hypothetical protein